MHSLTDGAVRLKRGIQSRTAELPLSASTLDAVSGTVGYHGRRCFWTPAVTLMTFLRQILHGNCACRQAVAITLAQSAADDAGRGGLPDGCVSGDPSAYAQARARLPLAWFAALHGRVAESLQARVGATRRWCGRRVFVVDGSTLSMPDTPSLQQVFPQPYGQKPGCGFPSLRLTAIFCHASGAVLDLAVDALRTREPSLLRRMLDRFRPGDVIVADRAYHGYADLADWTRRGLDVLLRLNEAACPDLRSVRRTGRDEQIAEWHRPTHRPRRLTAAQWADLPETMTVRLLRVRVRTPGFRTRRLELLTTLLDANAYPAEDVARLYRDRWMAELNLRSLKTTLGMDVLRGKSPDVVRKEVMMYAVTYNLIRTLMWQAAEAHGRDPQRLSFAGAQQRIAAMLPYLGMCRTNRRRRALATQLLKWIAADMLPHRPDRIEPRAVKRRPKSYVPLSIPREKYRRNLRQTHAA